MIQIDIEETHRRSEMNETSLNQVNGTVGSNLKVGIFHVVSQMSKKGTKAVINDEKSTQTVANRASVESDNKKDPFIVTFQVNLVALFLFFVAFAFRLWKLDSPHIYIEKGVFYFDAQPPFAIQLISIAAYFAGYDGNNVFKAIGGEYNANVPLKSLRFIPALCGSLIVPLVYQICIEIGLNPSTAILASLFVIFENSLLTQSRFILIDTILILLLLIGVYAFLKFRKKVLFSKSWFVWLFVSSTSLTLAVCVKFIGFAYLSLVAILCFYDFWFQIADKSRKTISLWMQSLIYFLYFIVWPIIIYCCVFYVHLTTLVNAGPHDNIMTSAFQASLEGGLASITKGQPLEIIHGSQITLRHTHGRTCWLHSHTDVYPIKYPDNRGSSHQQQVTCYSFKDVNNWWIVKKPQKSDLVASEPVERIKHGDIVQLVHGMSGRTLNSHDVAAAMSPHNQEVSCYINYNISMPSQNLWRIDLINGDDTDNHWHTIRSKIRLI
ncbi:protein O-mannosyl-transferase 1-like protein, partial [Leptotrombidium deliense]